MQRAFMASYWLVLNQIYTTGQFEHFSDTTNFKY